MISRIKIGVILFVAILAISCTGGQPIKLRATDSAQAGDTVDTAVADARAQ